MLSISQYNIIILYTLYSIGEVKRHNIIIHYVIITFLDFIIIVI